MNSNNQFSQEQYFFRVTADRWRVVAASQFVAGGLKGRANGYVLNKAVYLAIGITVDGVKEVLGMWIAETEGAKFWLQVVTELRNRGVQDIFIACVDGLKVFQKP